MTYCLWRKGREQKIGEALKFKFTWGFGARLCVSVLTPGEQLLPWQQWMEMQNDAKQSRIKTEYAQRVLACDFIKEQKRQ